MRVDVQGRREKETQKEEDGLNNKTRRVEGKSMRTEAQGTTKRGGQRNRCRDAINLRHYKGKHYRRNSTKPTTVEKPSTQLASPVSMEE